MVGIARRLSATYLPVAPGRFVITFVGMKAIAFVGLLWMARVSERGVFGAIELSLAVGTIVGTCGLIGLHGAASKLALAMDRVKINDLLAFAALQVAFLGSATAAVAWLLRLPPIWALCAAACAPAAAQATLAAYARTRALPMLNSIVDPLAPLTMIAVVVFLNFFQALSVYWIAVVVTTISIIITFVSLYIFIRCVRDRFLTAYVEALRIGWPMLVFGLVAMAMGAGLRPLLAGVFSLQALAVYSLCYRLAGGLLIFHQVITTAVFTRLYRSGSKGFDHLVMGASAFLVLLSIVLWAILPLLVALAFPSYRAQVSDLIHLFPLVAFQMILWIINALLENRVNRHGVSRRAAAGGVAILIVYCPLVLILRDFWSAVAMFDVMLAIFAFIQTVILWKKKDQLPLTAVTVTALAIGTMVCLVAWR